MILEKAEPQSKDWSIFFNASLDYIEQNWGIEEETRGQFSEKYKRELLTRMVQGERSLYLFKTDNEYLGFAKLFSPSL